MSDEIHPPTTCRSPDPEFAIVRPHAAGLDIGAEEIWAASPPGEHAETVREFGTFTADLQSLVQWLKSRGVTTVAMESTGVYWIPVYDLLQRAGFEVFLVNAHHVKSVTGRKTDLYDCQWIQKLHACGLLKGSFRPDDVTVAMRSLFRHRMTLVREGASCIQRMQKALTEMNVQLHHAVTDITGKTGLAIIDAILAGERDPHQLAKLRDRRCKSDAATIAKALTGTWRDEHIFAIRQHLESWRHYQQQMLRTDAELVAMMPKVPDHQQPLPPTPIGPSVSTPPSQDSSEKSNGAQLSEADRRKRSKHNASDVSFDARTLCHQKFGVDITAIEGIGPNTALTILTEVGSDFSRFPSSAAFCAWLGLAPNTKISGGKKLSSRIRKTQNRVNQALRQAANALRRSKSALGAMARGLEHRLGTSKALVAMAHRLGRYVYAMVTRGSDYLRHSLEELEQRRKDRQRTHLKQMAMELGYALVPQ